MRKVLLLLLLQLLPFLLHLLLLLLLLPLLRVFRFLVEVLRSTPECLTEHRLQLSICFLLPCAAVCNHELLIEWRHLCGFDTV